MKRVAVLGATGSVGESALRVISAAGDRFSAVALAGGRNYERLAEQSKAHHPLLVALAREEEAHLFRELLGAGCPELAVGEEGLCRAARMAEADVILIAVSGSSALAPALAAVRAGKTVALANKESLVMAGELIMAEAQHHGAVILPVDSEHAGIFQILAGRSRDQVKRIILPASGGPFLDTAPEELSRVSPEAALRHPTWNMGKKITVDSATLMNKALEIIEAYWLFGLPAERIEVIIHPESVVHAMVELEDGTVIAQLSAPDMRLPILHALAWPERIDAGLPRLELSDLGRLTFRPCDPRRFPAPALAYQALEKSGTAGAVLAAADEAAVEAFLHRRLAFSEIVPLVAEILELHSPAPVDGLAQVAEAEAWAREEVTRRLS